MDFEVGLAAILLEAALEAAPVLSLRLVHLLVFFETAGVSEKLAAAFLCAGEQVFIAPAMLLLMVFQVGFVLEGLRASSIQARELAYVQLYTDCYARYTKMIHRSINRSIGWTLGGITEHLRGI
jgi:hypothetical protein